jgi:hypothetical protein
MEGRNVADPGDFDDLPDGLEDLLGALGSIGSFAELDRLVGALDKLGLAKEIKKRIATIILAALTPFILGVVGVAAIGGIRAKIALEVAKLALMRNSGGGSLREHE